jgi:5,10-methylenetetrahydromethanopterin reductase
LTTDGSGVEISVGLPPAAGTPELVAHAEQLGFARAWIFDSAPLWEDPFVHLALAAATTERIGLGTAVLVPSERSPLAMASSIATIARLAPDRLRCAFGTGYTARLCAGQRPITLAALGRYLRQLRGLLAGEVVDIDGAPAAMLHWEGITAARPVPVELWLSVFGPGGRQLAAEVADGIIGSPVGDLPAAAMVNGTVLDADESFGSERSIAAVAPWRLTAWHMAASAGRVDQLPDGREWYDRLEAEGRARGVPPHLLIHEGHVTHVTPRDRPLLPHLPPSPFDAEPPTVRARLTELARQGYTEAIYNPAGPDIGREMEAWIAAARLPEETPS